MIGKRRHKGIGISKKLIISSILLFILCLNVFSQPKEKQMLLDNEFYASYGFASVQELASLFGAAFFSMFYFTDTHINEIGLSGPIMIGYKRVFWHRLGVGLFGSYSNINLEIRKNSDNSLLFNSDDKYLGLILRLDGYYVINEWVQMYSGISFGTMDVNAFPSHGVDKVFPALQLNILGLRVGKSFGGFAEFGFGYNGVINLGFSYKF